jgi:drug/metabolite transporter (DMT)-like permease
MDTFGASMLVLQAGLLGLNQVLIKMVNAGLQPVFQAGLRSACAVVPILLFALLTRKKLSVTDGTFKMGLLCGTMFSLEFLVLFIALDLTSVARVSVLFYTMPVWFTVAAHFLLPNESLTPRRILGLTLAVIGVAVAMADRQSGNASLTGDLLALAASLCWAVIALLCRGSALKNAAPEMQLLYQLTVSAIILLPLSLLFGDLVRDMTTTLAWVFAFQVIVVLAFGFSLWFWILSIYPAAATTSFSFLAPVFGVFFGWLILGEQLSNSIVIALVLVCAGIVLITRASQK